MTTLDTAAHVSASATAWVDGVASPVERALVRVRDWNDARVTRRMLGRLSSRQLEDIGLCRDDIAAVAARGQA